MSSDLILSTFNLRLKFRQPAGTSRGIYTVRNIWYVTVARTDDPLSCGLGECAPLEGLSCDLSPDYAERLSAFCRRIEREGSLNRSEELERYPSILFGLETAFRHLEKGDYRLWDTPFSRGEEGIPINGLIWMGDQKEMLVRIEEKLKAGFKCLKLKIGSIDFDDELSLLHHIRRHFTAKEVEIRVDANGAFRPNEALERLKRLSEFELHSIEQPVRAGQWELMAGLVDQSPLPIALDEELIGLHSTAIKRKMLETVRPHYIILKPSLHGGFSGCGQWIEEARRTNAGYWITSALESNIGLNAIAQWCATLNNPMPQGLGTGGLYINNINLPLKVEGDQLRFSPEPNQVHFPIPMTNGATEIQTSGSTGKPKTISICKEKMVNSARLTCKSLGLGRGTTALLCMNTQYIGARMMMARTLVGGLNLTVREASGHPLEDVETSFDFAAMTALQVYNSLQIPTERERLKEIKHLLIGGGSIDEAMEKELKTFPNAVYSTYGMTETSSHIALRRINGKEASDCYEPFDCVKLSLTGEGTLAIDAPMLCDNTVETNDIAELMPDGRFRIVGRKDNVINSGGVKINAETVENKLRQAINVPFAITAVPDAKFGESIVLLIERGADIETIQNSFQSLLSKYERPRTIIEIEALPFTANGKIDRMACRGIAEKVVKLRLKAL